MNKNELSLRDFISKSLTDIIEGVEDARKELGNSDSEAWIAPGPRRGTLNEDVMLTADKRMIDIVEFDVSVNIQHGSSGQCGVGVIGGPVGIGSRIKRERSSKSLNRMKFSIPIAFSRGEPIINSENSSITS